MTSRRARHAASLLLAAALATSAAPAAAQWAAADVLKDEARVLAEKGDLKGAVEKLRLAYEQRPTHEIAANLGVLETKLELWVAAVEHLTVAVAAWPKTSSAESRSTVERALSEARSRVAEVEVRVDRPGARVFLDGTAVGLAPLAKPLVVEPRRHVIAAELEGFRASEIVVVPSEGSRSVVEIAFEPAPPAASASPDSSSATGAAEPATSSGSTGFSAARPWLATTFGVLGAAGLASGIALTLASNGHASAAEALIAPLPEGACGESGPARTCLEIGGALGLRDATAQSAIASYVVGGVGLAALVVVLLVPDDVAETSSASRTGLVGGPGDVGLGWAQAL